MERIKQAEWADTVYNPPHPAKLHSRLEKITQRARDNGYQIPLEVLCAEFGLSQPEKLVLLLLFFARLSGEAVSGTDLLRTLGGGFRDLIANLTLLSFDGRLVANRLIKMRREFFWTLDANPLTAEYEITEEVFWRICGQDNPWQGKREEKVSEHRDQEQLIWIKEPEVSLEQLVLPQAHLSRMPSPGSESGRSFLPAVRNLPLMAHFLSWQPVFPCPEAKLRMRCCRR